MKISAIVGTTVLSLALGTSVPALAQHGHDEHHGGPQNHGNEAHGRPAAHEEHHAVARPPEHRVAEHRPPVHPMHPPHAVGHVAPHGPHGDIWARGRAQHWSVEHRTWRQRGGYVGYRIPEARFHEQFGRGHYFRVYGAPMMVVEGRPRFQYGGFWFTVVDPIPEVWAAGWYRTDDVYVDYVNDGYYLCNRSHPGFSVAINVSL